MRYVLLCLFNIRTMKSFTFSAASSLAAMLLVLAPSAAQVAAQATNASAIPTNVSASCSSFLSTLNSDTQLDACTKPLLQATRIYSSNATDSSTQLDSTLTELCSADTGCDPNIIRARLDQFWQNCHTDLQSKNTQVQAMYDNLYMITPLVNSICAKDKNADYCLKTIAKAAATSQRVAATTPSRRSLDADADEEEDDDDEEWDDEDAEELVKRQSTSSTDTITGLTNATDSSAKPNTNAAFLFISSSSPKSILCSQCTQLILASYIKFETSIPYAIGLRTSEILAPQSDIYKAAKSQCGNDFVVQVNKIANTTGFAAVASSAPGVGARSGVAALATLAAAAVVALVAL